MMMNVIPYKTIDGLPFGCGVDDVVRKYGKPIIKYSDLYGSTILEYAKFAFTFQSENSNMVHFSMHDIAELRINGEKFEWSIEEYHRFIENDGHPLNALGLFY